VRTRSRGSPLLDLHVHSALSADGESSIGDYARRAAQLGLNDVTFCEHIDFDPRDSATGFFDAERYGGEFDATLSLTARGDGDPPPGVRLHKGVEITYQSGREAEIRYWLGRHRWDMVVLSVHLVDYADGWAIVSERDSAGAYFLTHDPGQAYVPYLEELLCAAQSGLGDVLGHFDLVKRYGVAHYGSFRPQAYEEEIRAVLRTAIQHGVGLEINTSGLRQAPAEPYPGRTVLDWYQELGGEILTIGSDAHHVAHLGAGCAEAAELARSVGYRAATVFEERQPRWIDLS
jgi:histidinol-phosphatase (PHP family)